MKRVKEGRGRGRETETRGEGGTEGGGEIKGVRGGVGRGK